MNTEIVVPYSCLVQFLLLLQRNSITNFSLFCAVIQKVLDLLCKTKRAAKSGKVAQVIVFEVKTTKFL